MPRGGNPFRIECEQYVKDEVARVGIAAVDVAAISRVFAAKGASRTRARAWADAILAEQAALAMPEIAEQRRLEKVAAVEAERAARALVQAVAKAAQDAARAKARAEVRAVEVAVEAEVKAKAAADKTSLAELAALMQAVPGPAEAEVMAASVEAVQRAIEAVPDISIVPDAARALHDHMGLIIDTHRKVMAVSLYPDGKMRNARQSIAAGEALRRAVESMAKLYETLNNVAMIETFMRITLAEVAKLSPQTAGAIVVELRAIQQQWSAPSGRAP